MRARARVCVCVCVRACVCVHSIAFIVLLRLPLRHKAGVNEVPNRIQ